MLLQNRFRLCRRRAYFILGTLILAALYLIFSSSQNDVSTYEKHVFEALKSEQSCVFPELLLWHPELKVYSNKPTPLRCSETEENWVYTTNGTFYISRNATAKHGNITCIYIPILRGKDDFQFTRAEPIKPMINGTQLVSDVFEAKCVGSDGSVKTYILVGIAPNEEVQRREKVVHEGSPLDLDILMFGFDSVSRMTWMRNLPKSYKYFVEILGGVVLEGYNIVGDGTPQALLPMLTGKTELELPEARRGIPGATTVDGHPWIWNDLKKLGYAIQWGEDEPRAGTFTYRMLGFKNQPVDHYIRTFYLAASQGFSKYHSKCLGSMTRHQNMMNWMRDFIEVYAQRRKFSFAFHTEYSHDGYTELKHADDDLKKFLEHLHTGGHLDRAILVLMSDHGARFQSVRNTEQGKYEERMPFFGVRLPTWFKEKHPDAASNLRTNAHRLVTPFDVHATFRDVIDFGGAGLGDLKQRGISLFKEIPKERSCADAAIEPHWCSCLSWTSVSSDDPSVQQAALTLVRTINSLTGLERAVCEKLSLLEVTRAVEWTANDHLLRFRKNADSDGRKPVFGDTMSSSESLFQVTVRTRPGNALYEGTVKYFVRRGRYTISEREISRINKYGNQPHCVMDRLPHLRKYCYCKKQRFWRFQVSA